MGMELLMQRLAIAIAVAVVHGLSFAERLSKHPLSSSPQRDAFAPCTLTFPGRPLFSETRAASISPRKPGIADQPPLFSPTDSPPLLPSFSQKEKIPISPPTISISTSTVLLRKKMKSRHHLITAAVIPASPLLREPPLLSPLTKHPVIPRFRYSSLNSNEWLPVSIPLTPQPVQKHHGIRNKIHNEASAPSFTLHHHSSKPGTVYPPPQPKKTHLKQNFRADYALTSNQDNTYVPTPALISAPNQRGIVPFVPFASPPKATPESRRGSFVPPVVSPPPPTEDCSTFECMEPLTNSLPGTRCGCVQPVQVGLRLNVSVYSFFPLGKNLTDQIAAGVLVKQNQVRIMSVDSSTQKPEETIVIIDVVPFGASFDTTAALLIYNKFWNKNVVLGNEFGKYDVLYVCHPGLPPAPPIPFSDIAEITGSHSGHGNNEVTEKPLGADVSKSSNSDRLSSRVIAIVVLSASVGVILITATAWLVMFQCQHLRRDSDLPPLLPSHIRQSDGGSGSFASCIAANLGSAKIFSYAEVQQATGNFDASKIVGDGGFGCVYSGVLQDGTHIAVKVLKRDDDHGDREFMAEVEMLSRLHHRHLVKLIGICIEAHNRCLIYELVPNGSVESHLHGQDKERSPLDWVTRLKIALGSARALAYLHEDSNPKVIHRDFKSSNILLEDDFTPKVSDFGLARTGIEEKNEHISTRVMGTFGYVAPEYAMTGHLLVKSDVYSYGVVLLELLTGKKPVDMSQPPGEENLVTWARPLLTSMEGLESVFDKSLTPVMSYESVAKVAAIASLCVQPEVSLRPYMGEVVQALKLLYDQCGDCASNINYGNTGSSSQFSIPLNLDYPTYKVNSELDMDEDLCISVSSEISNGSPSFFLGRSSFSLRRHSTSGPETSLRKQFWRRIKLSF